MNDSSHVPTASIARYQGDVSPAQAWEALGKNQEARLVDVRTVPEWEAGTPDLSSLSKQTIHISIKNAPDYEFNANFLSDVVAALPDKNTPIYFMCKGGGRSSTAATMLTELGYTNCYNIIGGFEGKGEILGWKATQLPWGTK